MREILLKAGYKECLSKEIADIFIINTCTVTRHADRESRHFVKLFHRTNPKAKIAVVGCYVEKNADEISFLPGVVHIVKNPDKAHIAEILDGISAPDSGRRGDTPYLSITDFKDRTKAFIKIQDGCENRCSYCKVPLVRGDLKSKPLDKIIEEVKALASRGFKELILAGICLGAWGKDLFPTEMATSMGLKGASLLDVLKALDKINGDFRIRLSSIEPKYITDELIEFISGSKKFCRHLHIPLQSGDDEILKYMNRPYTAADYRGMIEKIKHAMDDIAISTDVMVGFPGESDANFKNTLNFVKSITPARMHIFTYSKREGTAAYGMPGAVSEIVVKKRYHDLRAAALMSSYIYQSKFMGKALKVLVESRRERQSGLLTGYSDNYIKMLFDGPDSIMGSIVTMKLEELTMGHAIGTFCQDGILEIA